MKLSIYLDKDEVLADFIGPLCSLHGVKASDVYRIREERGDWDCAYALGELINGSYDDPLHPDRFWSPIHGFYPTEERFWELLRPLPWKDALLKLIHDYDPDFRIVTAPSKGFSCYRGKAMWIHDNVKYLRTREGYNNPKRVIIMGDKGQLAKPGRILIDDRPETIESWVNEGGYGILFPRGEPSNVLAGDPVAYVKGHLDLAIDYYKTNTPIGTLPY